MIMLIFRKIEVERVAVVEFGMNQSSGVSTESFVVQRGAYTAKVANEKKAAFR